MTNHPHHFHKRKRVHKNLEPYPHPDKLKRFVDHIIYGVGIFIPLMTFLQSYKIWSTQTAHGVSILTFGGYATANCIWLLYGILHKEKPLILMYTLSAIFNASIVAGILVHG